MVELDDYELNRTPTIRRFRPGRWGGVPAAIAVLVVGGLIAVYLVRRPAPEPTPAPAESAESPVAATDDSVTATEEVIEDADESVALPALDESDDFVRDLVRLLSAHPTFVAFVATEGLVRTFVVAIDNMAEGDTPARHLPVLAPHEPFRVSGTPNRLVIDPTSYARYDLIADAFESLDVDGSVELYARLKPLMVDAYRDLGHPDGEFDAALAAAVDYVLRTPLLDQNVLLVSYTVAYEFADGSLEALPPVQQQALRLGPRNLRLVQRKLRELAAALGLSTHA